jgi:hypothetical protein
MRTTLTLDPDVAREIKRQMSRTGKGIKATVNDALRQALIPAARRDAVARFVVEPHRFGVRPGIDLDRVNQLVDELEAEESRRGVVG